MMTKKQNLFTFFGLAVIALGALLLFNAGDRHSSAVRGAMPVPMPNATYDGAIKAVQTEADKIEKVILIKDANGTSRQVLVVFKSSVQAQLRAPVPTEERAKQLIETSRSSGLKMETELIVDSISTEQKDALKNASIWLMVIQIAVPIGTVILLVWLSRRESRRATDGGGSQPAGYGRNDAQKIGDKVFGQWIDPKEIKGNGFADVAGVPEAIIQMKKLKLKIVEQASIVKKVRDEAKNTKANEKAKADDLMERLQSMTKRSRFGGKLPQCVLLEGPPGTGKTLLVTALAKECDVPVFVISGSDFVEMYVGVGASRVREMFAAARNKRPCLIFIDELDAVGRARSSGNGMAHPEAEQTLNQILVELQGLNTGNQNFGLWIFGATNRVDILDPALLRPGRFTWKIKVNPPHLNGRVDILNLHSKNRGVPLDKSVDFQAIASVLPGFTGADLENVVNETALYAEELAEAQVEKIRADRADVSEDEIKGLIKENVTQEDFFEGLLRHLMGVKTTISLTFDQIFNTVVHEAGHALAAAYEGFLGRTDAIVRFIAVEPRGRSGGLTFKTPRKDQFTTTLENVDADAVCGFGGSAAQLVFLNTKDSGPDNDFEVAAAGIHRAIARWYGSEKLGPISLGQRGMTGVSEMGAAQKDLIDSECNLKTKVLYARSWWIMKLFIRSESVWTMFFELLERKIMTENRFAELFAEAMREVEAHPEWAEDSLDNLLSQVKKDPYGWSPALLDEGQRAYLNQRIEELRMRYLALADSRI